MMEKTDSGRFEKENIRVFFLNGCWEELSE